VLTSDVNAREILFARLVDSQLAAAYRTAAAILGDPADAEDVIQDAMLRAWQRLDQMRDQDRMAAWFGRILVNACRDRLRGRRRPVVRWTPPPAATATLPDVAERDALLRALAGLNPDQRIAIVLRYYLDLPLETIAERTSTPLGTVKTRLHHGLQAMRAAYEAAERQAETDR
jgi:RNA polymerase sigma-70 factor (ECF subfamily)